MSVVHIFPEDPFCVVAGGTFADRVTGLWMIARQTDMDHFERGVHY